MWQAMVRSEQVKKYIIEAFMQAEQTKFLSLSLTHTYSHTHTHAHTHTHRHTHTHTHKNTHTHEHTKHTNIQNTCIHTHARTKHTHTPSRLHVVLGSLLRLHLVLLCLVTLVVVPQVLSKLLRGQTKFRCQRPQTILLTNGIEISPTYNTKNRRINTTFNQSFSNLLLHLKTCILRVLPKRH